MVNMIPNGRKNSENIEWIGLNFGEDIKGTKRMIHTNFSHSASMRLAFEVLVKCLNKFWIECREICTGKSLKASFPLKDQYLEAGF